MHAQPLDRQAVREARAERRGEHAGRDDERERRQVHVAELGRRQAFDAQPMQDVARGAGEGDRQAVRRRRADRAAQRHIAPGEERDREERAAGGEQAGHRADNRAGGKKAARAGQLASCRAA